MKKVRIVPLFLLFNLILGLALAGAGFVLRNKEYSGAQDLFRKWNPEHADIVFIGNSHQFCSISTDILNDEFGIESFMLATSAQTIPMSYYAAKEAIELKHPDTIVLEISYVANDFMVVGQGMDHSFFDGMPFCKARTEALKDLYTKEERIYYYLPIGLYHSRWRDLTEQDFKPFSLSDRGTFTSNELYWNAAIPLVSRDDTEPMPEKIEEYFVKIIDLCRENNVGLVMYAAPFNSLEPGEPESDEALLRRERIYNYALTLAGEHETENHNLFYELDAIGLDDHEDWMDSQHLNSSGQAKFTRYMASMGYLGNKH